MHVVRVLITYTDRVSQHRCKNCCTCTNGWDYWGLNSQFYFDVGIQ